MEAALSGYAVAADGSLHLTAEIKDLGASEDILALMERKALEGESLTMEMVRSVSTNNVEYFL